MSTSVRFTLVSMYTRIRSSDCRCPQKGREAARLLETIPADGIQLLKVLDRLGPKVALTGVL